MKLIQYLEECAEITGIKTSAEAKLLANVLTMESMKQAMGEIARELEQRNILTTANLHSKEGLEEARARQAEINGMFAVLERLFALTEFEDKDETVIEETK